MTDPIEPVKTVAQAVQVANQNALPAWLQTVLYAAFASFAGGLGYILRTMEANATPTLTRTCVEALAAGLVGLLAMWICQAMDISLQWTAITVGVSGWLGANATIQVLQRLVWRKLGLDNSFLEYRRHDDSD